MALSITKRVLDLSPDLAAVIGKNKATRPEAVAGLWKYINEHNCKDAVQKGIIKPDATLKRVLGKDAVKNTELFGLISKHVTDNNPKVVKPVAASKKAKRTSTQLK